MFSKFQDDVYKSEKKRGQEKWTTLFLLTHFIPRAFID